MCFLSKVGPVLLHDGGNKKKNRVLDYKSIYKMFDYICFHFVYYICLLLNLIFIINFKHIYKY